MLQMRINSYYYLNDTFAEFGYFEVILSNGILATHADDVVKFWNICQGKIISKKICSHLSI